jgi:glycosyltransferase involved in cell wall biosynthesis
MPDSVHTARWIKQVSTQHWDLHVFPVDDAAPHPDLANVTFHSFSRAARPPGVDRTVRFKGPYPFRRGSHFFSLMAQRFFMARMARAERLAAVIRRTRPDLIHSLEMQHCAYLTLEARKTLGSSFPTWFVSSWGNDVYLFGRLTEHAAKVREVLTSCDYFTADCNRDLPLAREYGFKGQTFPALPGAGGFDIELVKRLRPAGLTSARRVIALKGYQHSCGRALDGLRAIELCADVLKEFVVALYFPNPEVCIAAELMSQRTGIKIEIVPKTSYEESLRMHGRARLSIGISISDGLPLSTMEAALMGSFPIQTNTSCVDEWLRDGVGTLLVPAEDPQAIAVAIRRAVTDDDLVDRAAEINFQVIAEQLNLEGVKSQVVAMYQDIFAGGVNERLRG